MIKRQSNGEEGYKVMRCNQSQKVMSKTHSCPSRKFQEGGDQEGGCRAGRVIPPHAQPPAQEPPSATAETLSNGDKLTRLGNNSIYER